MKVGLGEKYPALEVRAWAAYSGLVPPLIRRFKFGGQRRLAIPLAARLAKCVEEDLTDFDLLCAVPTHRGRFLRRGFNPGALLARHLAPPGTVPICCLLRRAPGLAPQAQLPLGQREEAPFGLFGVRRRQAKKLPGARVLLLDDVCTTGATLSASAQVLYAGGADWVEGLVLARTLRRRPDAAVSGDAPSQTCL